MIFNQETLMLFMGLAAGSVGGLAAALSAHHRDFRALPTKSTPPKPELVRAQNHFFWSRVIYGALLGFIVTLACLESVRTNALPVTRLAFIQAISGMSASVVKSLAATAGNKLKALVGG